MAGGKKKLYLKKFQKTSENEKLLVSGIAVGSRLSLKLEKITIDHSKAASKIVQKIEKKMKARMKAQMKAAKEWYGRTYRRWPYPTAFVTCYLKGSIADVITQTKVESTPKMQSTISTEPSSHNQSSQLQSFFETDSVNVACLTEINNNEQNVSNFGFNRLFNWFNRVDWMRNWRFSMYSGLYCGCVQHVVYCIIWPRLIIDGTLRVALFKTVADATIHVPLYIFQFTLQ